MILGIEIALLILGIVALSTGKLTLTQGRIVRGTPARLLGVVGVLPLPLALCFVFAVGVIGGSRGQSLDDLRWLFVAGEVLIVVICLGVIYGVGWAYSQTPEPVERDPLVLEPAPPEVLPVVRRAPAAPRDAVVVGARSVPAATTYHERAGRPPRAAAPEPAPAVVRPGGLAFALLGAGALTFGVLVLAVACICLLTSGGDDRLAAQPGQIPPGQLDPKGVPFPPNNPPDRPAFVLEPPVRVALVNGAFETPVAFDANAADPGNNRITKRFQFDATADTVYWVRTAEPPPVDVYVEGPAGPVTKPGDFGQLNREVAFLAEKAGTYTAVLRCDRFAAGQGKLTIRAMDGTVPLPDNLKIKSATADLPRIEQVKALNVYDKQFAGAAFSPDSKHFWMSHGDGTISFWQQPGPVEKGNYKGDVWLLAMAVDGQGRLYAQTRPRSNEPLSLVKPGVGDIQVWEDFQPKKPGEALPRPSKTLPLAGAVSRLISSPDGRWIYFLDVHNHKLGRIDTTTVTVEKILDNLSPDARAFCMTPDGKTLYVASGGNQLDVIDAGPFQVRKTVRLDRGRPTDLAATDRGMVFLVGEDNVQIQGANLSWGGNSMVVDLTKGVPEQTKVMPLPVKHHTRFVRVLPDGRVALFSGDRKVTACALPSRPALFQTLTRDQTIRDYFMPGRIFVSPDGRTLLYDSAVILSISR